MNAETTACAVLDWAIHPSGPLPHGPLDEVTRLAEPSEDTLARLRLLTRSCAARLGAGAPPFGDPGPIRADAILLAAAIGARARLEAARLLVNLVANTHVGGYDQDGSWSEALARHAVVGCALPATPDLKKSTVDDEEGRVPVDDPLVEALLGVSPLTRVLYRPPRQRLIADAIATEVDAAARLLARPAGRRVLVATLAAPVLDPAVLSWRHRLLSRLVHEHREFVLDVYEVARLHHASVWDGVLHTATRRLSGFRIRPRLPLALLQYWVPLAGIERSDPALLRDRPFLEGHRSVLTAIDRYGLLSRGET
jgi:hypothetical protein